MKVIGTNRKGERVEVVFDSLEEFERQLKEKDIAHFEEKKYKVPQMDRQVKENELKHR